MPEASPDAEVAKAAARFRLSLTGARYRGRIGQQRGRGVGSSHELQDFRDYAPGDDLRHVDWRGYARTDQLRVRLFEAEVAPTLELCVDTSASMAVGDAKRGALRALVGLFRRFGAEERSHVRALALGGHELTGSEIAFDGPAAAEIPAARLCPGAVRVLLTDALWQADPAPLLRRLAASASRFCCVQLLDPEERSPPLSGTVTLRDAEAGTTATLRLDEAAVRIYRERLARLVDGLADAVAQLGGTFASVDAGPLVQLCERGLLPAGVVAPR